MWRGWWGRGAGAKVGDEAATKASPAPDRGPREFTPEDEELLDRIARAVARWSMTVPAIFLLESSKPLSFVGSQLLHFLSPIVSSVFDADELDRFAVLLERRETVENLIERIEAAEAAGTKKPPPREP